MILEMCIVPASIVSTERNANLLAVMLQLRDPFMMNLVPNKQLLIDVPFQSIKYRKKELCVDNKVQETIGDVYCPTCRIEKCVYI